MKLCFVIGNRKILTYNFKKEHLSEISLIIPIIPVTELKKQIVPKFNSVSSNPKKHV